jgi:hypothetical protein
MLEENDLGPADEALLNMLREGRVTAPFAAEETGYSLQYVRDRLGRLVEHGNAQKVYEGLYELVDDPRANPEQHFEKTGSVTDNEPDLAEPEGVDIHDRMEARLEQLDVKGRPAAVERTRRQAVKYAWGRLREEGEMQPSRLADDVMGQFFDHPDLGYSVSSSDHPGYQLLDNVLRDVMLDLPGVHSTGRVWQFHEGDR